MNITEITIGRRAVATTAPQQKEAVEIKAITGNGLILVRTAEGKIVEITPEKITKIIK